MTPSSKIDFNRIAGLYLCAALILSGLIFMPHAQHVFWAPEAFSAAFLAPLALLTLLAKPKAASNLDPRLAVGRGLLYLCLGLWFLSAAFAFRADLAGRELVTWLAAPLVFAAAWRLLDKPAFQSRLLFAIFAAGALQAIYAIIQSAGWEQALARALGPRAFGFHELNWAVTFGGRAGAFFGNPNFLGGHMALLLPLAVAIAMDERSSKKIRMIQWGSAVLIASGLVLSQTRGAWIGAMVGLGLMFYLCRRSMPGLLTRNRGWLISLASTALISLIVFLATHSQNLGRLSGMFKGDEELGRRLTLMRCSLSLIEKNPLLGVGPGNFRVFFPSVQTAGLSREQLSSRPYIVSSHAHNDFLQMAADTGIPSTLLMLALLTWVCLAFWRALGKSRELDREGESGSQKLLVAGVFGGVAALQVHGLANFPFLIAPTQMTAWAMIAIGLKLALPASSTNSNEAPVAKKWFFALAAALYAAVAFDSGRILMKDALWWVAEGEQKLGHHDLADAWLMKTLELDRREDRLWRLHGQTQLDRSHTINATGSLKEAVRLNPHFHEARISLGRAYMQLGEYAKAEEALAPTALEAPNLYEVWEPLAASLFMQSKFEQSVIAYDWAIFFNIASATMLENKAAALGSLGRFEEALATLEKSEALEPGRAKNYVNRAITHIKMGLKTQARAELIEAQKRDPSDSQARDLFKVVR